ncbi:helix-turn-helix domain-containing protein [Streptomyces sp. NPDC006798]|uniref:nSTAND1 domain-containing NTPase n=1 Tax=Streptomyces sp. NPDC006798 TaxID=3155462 RepID=UPI0033F407DA
MTVALPDGNRETAADLRIVPGPSPQGDEGFGSLLRRLRTERGLSLADLAARAHYSRGYISKVETGQKPVTHGFALCCDQALDAGGRLLALAPGPGATGRGAGPCPYPGLAAFRAEEAGWFFGRERVTAELVARLAEKLRPYAAGADPERPGPAIPTPRADRTDRADSTVPADRAGEFSGPVVVVGPSGAGKSSLLHAGLLPAVARGALPAAGSREWPVVTLTPTAHPLHALARAVAEAYDPATAGSSGGRRAPGLGLTPDAALRALHDGTFAAALRNASHTRPEHSPGLLIVADQFEEVFTLCPDPAERRRFIAALCDPALPAHRVLVVLGVRADFYGRCLEHPELVAALRHGQLPLGPMSPAELRTAITGPAERTGLTLEPGLVEVLLRDAGVDDGHPGGGPGGHPGGGAHALPLTAHALLTTWQQRDDEDRMTVAAYHRTGGIRGAVAASAERVYERLGAADRATARQLLLSLVRVGDVGEAGETGDGTRGGGGHHDTRRRVGHDRLRSPLPDPDGAESVLAAFAGARLLSLGTEGVELTHEALLYAWPRLRAWIDADRDRLRGRQRLVESAEAWERAGRDPALLYRGAQLELAVEWAGPTAAAAAAAATKTTTTATETTTTETTSTKTAATPEARFLAASLAHRDAEAATRRRRTRRLRQLVSALSALSVLTCAATTFAFLQRSAAIAERDASAAQVAVDQAERMRQVDPSQAMRLSLAAYRLVRTPATRGALLASSGSLYSTRAGRHHWTVNRLAFTGNTLVSAGDEGTVRLTDTRDPSRPRTTAVVQEPRPGTRTATSSDGRLLASGGDDGVVRVRVLDAGRRLDYAVPTGAPVRALAFHPHGHTLAVGGEDGSVRVWGLDATGVHSPRSARTRDTHRGPVNAIAFRPDGDTLASAGDDRTVRLWRLPFMSGPLRPAGVLDGHRAQVRTVAFAPDGKLLASGSFDRTVRLTPLTDPAPPPDHDARNPFHLTPDPVPGRARQLTGHQGLVNSVAFRADGRQLASAADDQTTRLWDVASGRQTLALPQPNPVRSVAYGPGGGTLATGDDEGLLLLWHLPPPVLLGPPGGIPVVHAPPGPHAGKLLVTGGGDGTVRLWRTAGGRPARGPDAERPVAVLRGHTRTVTALHTDGSGRLLVSGGDDGTARLWDIRDPARPVALGRIDQHRDMVYATVLSRDGELLVTGGEDHRARVWDVSDPRRPVALATLNRHTDRINGLALGGPGDRTLATVGGDYQARIWDLRDPRRPVPLAVLPHPNQVNRAAFSPDGRYLATTNDDRRVRIWDLTDVEGPDPAPAAVLVGHREASREVAYSPDGGTLVTTSDDRTAQLWQVTDPARPVPLTPLSGHTAPVTGAAFAPDGRSLVTSGPDSAIRFWSHDVASVIHRICALDGPGLSRDEWPDHFPSQPFRESCAP